jgi:hypothetical protein
VYDYTKSLYIKGAGKSSTTIQANYGNNRILDLAMTAGGFFYISDLTFDLNQKSYSNGLVSIESVGMGGLTVKIWNVDFNNYSGAAALMLSGHPYGVIWNCTFKPYTGTSGGLGVMVTGVSGKGTSQWVSWRSSSALGTANTIYFEDCTWDYPDVAQNDLAVDTYAGSRAVIRYSTLKNTYLGGHGLDSTPNGLAPVTFEWYNNKIQKSGNNFRPSWAGNVRGGTGVMHHNTFDSAWDSVHYFDLQNFRSCTGTSASPQWKLCDGTPYYLCSNINTDGSLQSGSIQVCSSNSDCGSYTCTAKFCSVTKDQICYVDGDCPGGETCNGTFDGRGASGYPCRDQIGRGSNQTLQPIYAWSNATTTGVTVTLGQDYCGHMTDVVQENRDYYNSTMPGYTAYTYPHPLRGMDSSSSLTPPPPTNLRIPQ